MSILRKIFGTSQLRPAKILADLDSWAARFEFPDFSTYVGVRYPADARASLYGDGERWALLFEAVQTDYLGGPEDVFSNTLHVYGNCLARRLSRRPMITVWPVDHVDGSFFVGDRPPFVITVGHSLPVHGAEISTVIDHAVYEGLGIVGEDPGHVEAHAFLRAAVTLHPNLFFATDEELHRFVPADLPLVLRLNDWIHPSQTPVEKPSDLASFQQIAEVLAATDAAAYQGTEGNTHWSRWPEVHV